MAEALLGQGLAQVALQDYRSALESFNRSITAKGDFVDPYLYRAETRYEFGDAAGAMADLDQAIALDNQRATAYLLRGVIHFAQDQANQARSDLNKAVELFSQQQDFDSATQARTLLAQLPAELPPAELPVTESAPPDNPAVAVEDDDDDDDDYKRRRRLSLRDVRSTWDRVRRSGRRRR
jgi:tetratricopeptide (TPR) repeat protein